MIFISYNHLDEVIVDTIVRRLEIEFGRRNIFYDKWSICPGDSIIGKMNEGLEQFSTFFFMVSQNSLQSSMVTREWQSALMKTIKNNLKFVPIRLTDCEMPAIIGDVLYLDLINDGIDNVIEKMKLIVKKENVYKPLKDIKNEYVEIKRLSDNNCEIKISTIYYAEQNPTFIFLCSISKNNLEISSKEVFYQTGNGSLELDFGYGMKKNEATYFTMTRPLVPNNPVYIDFIGKSREKLEIYLVFLKKGDSKPKLVFSNFIIEGKKCNVIVV